MRATCAVGARRRYTSQISFQRAVRQSTVSISWVVAPAGEANSHCAAASAAGYFAAYVALLQTRTSIHSSFNKFSATGLALLCESVCTRTQKFLPAFSFGPATWPFSISHSVLACSHIRLEPAYGSISCSKPMQQDVSQHCGWKKSCTTFPTSLSAGFPLVTPRNPPTQCCEQFFPQSWIWNI